MTVNVIGWLKQPTTIHGIAGAAGLTVAYGAYYVTRSPEIAIAAGGYTANAVCMAINDNSADKNSVEKLITDGINAVVAKHVNEMLPQLGADMRDVLAVRTLGQVSQASQQVPQTPQQGVTVVQQPTAVMAAWAAPKPPNT